MCEDTKRKFSITNLVDSAVVLAGLYGLCYGVGRILEMRHTSSFPFGLAVKMPTNDVLITGGMVVFLLLAHVTVAYFFGYWFWRRRAWFVEKASKHVPWLLPGIKGFYGAVPPLVKKSVAIQFVIIVVFFAGPILYDLRPTDPSSKKYEITELVVEGATIGTDSTTYFLARNEGFVLALDGETNEIILINEADIKSLKMKKTE